MSLAKAINEWTVWHKAAEKGKLEEMRKLWEWVKEIVTPGVLMDKLTLAKTDREYTAWQVAALMGN